MDASQRSDTAKPAGPPYTARSSAKHARARTGLGASFDRLNTEFFGGSLPRYRVVRAGIPEDGYCDNDRRLIRLSTNGEALRQTLLHEMCHIGCPDHGERFCARLDALAFMGEEWAVEEADSYRNDSYTLGDVATEVCNALAQIAHGVAAKGRARPPFRSLLSSLAVNQRMATRDFARRFPWVRQAWQKVLHDAAREERSRAALLARWARKRSVKV